MHQKDTFVWIKINRCMVNTIWFRFDLKQFREYFPACNTTTQQHCHMTPSLWLIQRSNTISKKFQDLKKTLSKKSESKGIDLKKLAFFGDFYRLSLISFWQVPNQIWSRRGRDGRSGRGGGSGYPTPPSPSSSAYIRQPLSMTIQGRFMEIQERK